MFPKATKNDKISEVHAEGLDGEEKKDGLESVDIGLREEVEGIVSRRFFSILTIASSKDKKFSKSWALFNDGSFSLPPLAKCHRTYSLPYPRFRSVSMSDCALGLVALISLLLSTKVFASSPEGGPSTKTGFVNAP
jgi:hypothetical protein